MIVVDIETSGLDPTACGIWQIGALDFNNPSNTFLEDARLEEDDFVDPGALKVTGKTEEELRDASKQSQAQLLSRFFTWVNNVGDKIFIAHNTVFDFGFIDLKARKYGLRQPFAFRTYDLHVFAAAKYLEVIGRLPIDRGHSTLSLPKVIGFCGMEDPRMQLSKARPSNGVASMVSGSRVIKEGIPHDGLVDAKLEAECLSRILYGRGLFEEFNKFEIPTYLRKKHE